MIHLTAMYAMVRIEVGKFDDLIVDDVSFMKFLIDGRWWMEGGLYFQQDLDVMMCV